MGNIKPIEGESVHRIHAGQVVLELQQAVKELVENSLDAGATSIEVRIKDHGKDIIEVIDNGSGIAEEDWPSIGLKHHTSKLPSFVDLPHVTTFGFRGEALSALCALCENVTVVTATRETAPLGAIIKLGKDGKVQDCSGRVARPRGTTITLSGLFVPLPVRRKEFERTAKREYTKTLTTLTAYALVPASVSKEDGREGVRLKVDSVASGKNGKRNAVIVTDGRGSLRSSVISVWGPKALEHVLDLHIELEVGVDRSMAKREGLAVESQTVKVAGLISTAAWGQGRSSPDRQFYYMNGRPVDLPVVAKAVNEVYRSFNTHQLPLVVLDFSVPRESVDINVSPDKRSIFLHSEAQLVETLKIALEDFFQPTRSSFALEGASQKVAMIQSQLAPSTRADPTITMEDDQQSTDGSQSGDDVPNESDQDERLDEDSDKENLAPPKDRPVDVTLTRSHSVTPTSRVSRSSASSRPAEPEHPSTSGGSRIVQTIQTSQASWSPDRRSGSAKSSKGRSERAGLRRKLQSYASQTGRALTVSPELSDEQDDSVEQDGTDGADVLEERETMQDRDDQSPTSTEVDEVFIVEEEDLSTPNTRHLRQAGQPRGSTRFRSAARAVAEPDLNGSDADATSAPELDGSGRNASPAPPSVRSSDAIVAGSEAEAEPPEAGPSRRRRPRADETPPVVDDQVQEASSADATRRQYSGTSYRDEITSTAVNGEVTLTFDLDHLRRRYTKRRRRVDRPSQDQSPVNDAFSVLSEGRLSSAAGIGNRDITTAGEALSRVISKADFQDMEVLGQFNKGFIIARLRRSAHGGSQQHPADDLFIIDQHASDEKYNFETLQRTTVIKAQSLIRPRPLELTAGDEIVAIENMDILHSNGFEVKVDEDKAPGRGERISLTAMPVSKETTFDFKDLEQLLHLLSDGSRPAGQMVRCTKARSMFAMRACRKSVMIGKSLTKGQMVNLLRNMGTIDQPWNCPHGRPTMRHLTKLDPPVRQGSWTNRIDWATWSSNS